MLSKAKQFIREKIPFMLPPIKSVIGFTRKRLSKIHIRRLLRERDEIFLELGGGERKGKGKWVTIDMTKNCDLFLDILKGLPFPDGSVSKIYSSHFFEHFSFKETQKILNECFRVLAPGGTISICVPNAKLYIEAYLNGKVLNHDVFFTGWEPAYNNTTKIDYVNYVGHLDGHHKYMFDEENLIHILKAKGFVDVRTREFDLELDRKKRHHESIYVEGRKKQVG
ncbi:MAG: methyltransferase domain-containing protein [Crocinitomicaceae bacterium]